MHVTNGEDRCSISIRRPLITLHRGACLQKITKIQAHFQGHGWLHCNVCLR